MKEQFIQDLVLGTTVDSVFAIEKKMYFDYKRKAGQWLMLVVSDRTGQLPIKIWDDIDRFKDNCQSGHFVRVKGVIDQFQGNLEIRFQSIVPYDGPVERKDFIAEVVDAVHLEQQIRELITEITDPYLLQLFTVLQADGQLWQQYMTAPAAKVNHQAYIGGLAEHSMGIARTCLKIFQSYPELNKDLLITGALLHDIGKTVEYFYDNIIEVSDEGRLLGHIIQGVQLVDGLLAQIDGFPAELRLKLLHCIVSHHGEYEFQSPKRPKFAEALVLHLADRLDAELCYFREAAASAEPGNSFSPFNKKLGRYVYVR